MLGRIWLRLAFVVFIWDQVFCDHYHYNPYRRNSDEEYNDDQIDNSYVKENVPVEPYYDEQEETADEDVDNFVETKSRTELSDYDDEEVAASMRSYAPHSDCKIKYQIFALRG